MNDDERDRLRLVALAADRAGRHWDWRGGYPQQVLREGDAVLIATAYDEPDYRATTAEFIATFDPPTVLRLLGLEPVGPKGETDG